MGARTEVDDDLVKDALAFIAGWDAEDGDPDFEVVVERVLCGPQAIDMTLREILRRGVSKRVESLEQELAGLRDGLDEEVSARFSIRGDDDDEPHERDGREERLTESLDDGREFLSQLEG